MVLLLIVLFILLLLAAEVAVTRRRRRIANARIVFGQLAMLTGQHMPLGPGLLIAGQSERGRAGKLIRRIARLISDGVPIASAIEQAFPECPRTEQSMIRGAARSGRLVPTLRLIESRLGEDHHLRTTPLRVSLYYTGLLLTFTIILWSATLIAIIPKYTEILSDFETEFPPLTQGVLDATYAIRDALAAIVEPIGGVLYLLARWLTFSVLRILTPSMELDFVDTPFDMFLISFAALLAVTLPAWYLLTSGGGDESRGRRVLRRLGWYALKRRVHEGYRIPFDRILWHLPGWSAMERYRGLGAMLPMLRLYLNAGMPFDRAAALAADIKVNGVLRQRMKRFSELIRQGEPPHRAAGTVGLGDMVVTALRSGQHGDLDPALRYAGDYYRHAVSRLYLVLQSMSWPVLVIMMGLLIGLIALALFLPLVQLTNSVCAII